MKLKHHETKKSFNPAFLKVVCMINAEYKELCNKINKTHRFHTQTIDELKNLKNDLVERYWNYLDTYATQMEEDLTILFVRSMPNPLNFKLFKKDKHKRFEQQLGFIMIWHSHHRNNR